jgi:hypothetical protein
MSPRPEFHPLQAQEIARAFLEAGVDYLFIGKSGAILLGFPGTTQDVDVFPAWSAENGQRIVADRKTSWTCRCSRLSGPNTKSATRRPCGPPPTSLARNPKEAEARFGLRPLDRPRRSYTRGKPGRLNAPP